MDSIKSISLPKYVTLGTHYSCNAACKFCLGGDYPRFTFKAYKNFFEKKLHPVLKKAEHVGFCGYGELFLMPEIIDFLDYLNNQSLPDVTKVFTTNGLSLKKEIREKLVEGKYSLIISLHASNSKLHKFLLGRSGFEKVKRNIKELVKLKKRRASSLHINLVFLITNYNIENLPDFIKLAAELEADRVSCNYMTVFDIKQLAMSCFLQKEKTNDILERAGKYAEKYGLDLALPPYFNSGDDKSEVCDDPWNFFYAELQGSVLPCCFAGEHIGYLNKSSFSEIWNSPGYMRLRRGFIEDDPYEWCKNCYRYKKSNVDNLDSHITFRPDTRARILDYVAKEGLAKIKKAVSG